jgi:outer membrane protein assembly factor BamB
MRSSEILIETPVVPLLREERSVRRGHPKAAREVLDVFLAGAQVSTRVADAQTTCVLRDLALALTELGVGPRGKAIVRFYDDPWELTVERFGALALLSVYRSGEDTYVAVYDRAVAFDDVVESVRDAISAMLAKRSMSRPLEAELGVAQAGLASLAAPVEGTLTPPAASPVVVETDRDAPVSFGAEFVMRDGTSIEREDTGVERADLHALLFRGKLRAEIRGRVVELAEGHPFLFAERFLEVSRRALDAWERGLAFNVRAEIAGVLLGVRLALDGKLALTLGGLSSSMEARTIYTFPALGVADVVEASIGFGRALVRAVLRRDRSQGSNLRLSAFRRVLRETSEALREASRQDARINPTPEPYRAFAETSLPSAGSSDRSLAATRLRYAPRWRALVPGIDLRATFLCGDRLVVGSATETFCVERTTGEVLWRAPSERAIAVVTPGGVARLSADGTLVVHDLGNGEISLRAKVAPRLGGPPAGAVVNLPGLPRLVILTEGEHHLVAVDLTSGQARWRFTWGKARPSSLKGKAALRMKRAGKLVYFTSGDSALTALDVLTGAVVWRVRDRLRFRTPPTLSRDGLFAVAGGTSCLARLLAIDPFSGRVRWSAGLPNAHTTCTVEGAPLCAGTVVAALVRGRDGLVLVAFDRASGAPRWTSRPLAPVGTSWLAIDDLFVGNSPTGELVAVEAEDGSVRYRQVLGTRVLESDVPRRLEPVLRSGALFVPHTGVHVVRPRDGVVLGSITPCEAIPDLLRVDERCDVYVAEESGHLLSFSALPRLSLVRS